VAFTWTSGNLRLAVSPHDAPSRWIPSSRCATN